MVFKGANVIGVLIAKVERNCIQWRVIFGGCKCAQVKDYGPWDIVQLWVCYYKYVLEHKGGADKSLARPGRKQATVTNDFDVHIPYLLS